MGYIDINILDFIMYWVIFWCIIKILGEEYTTELGGLVGITVILFYTIIYLCVFVGADYNWIDLYHSWGIKWKISL